MSDLSHPTAIMARLEAIEHDLADRQNLLESAALAWFKAKREREHDRAVEFLRSEGTVAVRSAIADRATSLSGSEEEALYESLRAVVRTLETRCSVLQSLLRAMGRA